MCIPTARKIAIIVMSHNLLTHVHVHNDNRFYDLFIFILKNQAIHEITISNKSACCLKKI